MERDGLVDRRRCNLLGTVPAQQAGGVRRVVAGEQAEHDQCRRALSS